VVALQVAVGLVVVLLLIDAAYRPLSEWDAWAMWTMKAKAVTLLGGLDARVLAGVPYHHLHLDYPLLLPAVEAMRFRFLGSSDTQVIHLQPALLTAAARCAAAPPRRPGARRHRMGVGAAHRRGTVARRPGGAARGPRGFFAMAAVFGWRWLADGRREMLVLSSLFAAAVLDEARGTPFVAAFFLVLLIAAGRGGGSPRSPAVPPQSRRPSRGSWAPLERRRHLERRDPVRQVIDPGYLAGGSGGSRRALRRSSGTRSSRARGSSSCRPRRWR
jgi:hypothetical protein